MPILITLRSGSTTPIIDPDRRQLDFVSLDGTHVLEWAARPDGRSLAYILAAGITGLRVPPRRIVTEDYAGLDGQKLVDVSTGPREVFLPMMVASDDRQVTTHLAQLARIRAFCDYRGIDIVANEGSFDLVATAQDAKARRALRCTYTTGLEGSEGWSAGGATYFSKFGLKLLAVDPYWHGEEWSTPVVALPEAVPFLANDADAHPLRLGSNVAIGQDMPVVVGGDIESWPVVELTGPATSTHITSPSGIDVTIGGLSSGQQFVLDTNPRNRDALLDGAGGATGWSKVAIGPQWAALQPGLSSISIEMSGASSASRARVRGTSLWETAW